MTGGMVIASSDKGVMGERYSSSIYLWRQCRAVWPTYSSRMRPGQVWRRERGICAPRIHAVNKVFHARAKWFSRPW